MKIIFLDIDGVLNGYNWRTNFVCKICSKSKLLKKLWHKWDLFGIRYKYVYNLYKIIEATNAKVVLSSSWRVAWKIPYLECTDRMKSLKNKFYLFGIDVLDITPKCKSGKREDEITTWLNDTDYKIDSFVILDDESFDLQKFIGKELVQTSSVKKGEMIQGLWKENTGLKRKHVKKAIKILNKVQ